MNTIILFLLLTPIPIGHNSPESQFAMWSENSQELATFQKSTNQPFILANNYAQPIISFHMEATDPILLEIELEDGKTLLVKRDGMVTGNLAPDEAAKTFWKAFATAYSQVCNRSTEEQK